MEGTDVCFAPVLTLGEAPRIRTRSRAAPFVDVDGVAPARAGAALQPHDRGSSGARRRIPASTPTRRSRDWGFARDEIARLRDANAIA